MATRQRFQVDGVNHAVQVDESTQGVLTVRIDGGEPFEVDATTSGVPGLFSIIRDGVPSQAYVTREGKALRVLVDGRVFILGPVGSAGRGRGAASGMGDPPGKVSAPLAGVVVDVRVKEGDTFEARQTLVVVEAMKMQNEVQAPVAGTVTRVSAVLGDRVEKGDIVVEYDPAEE
ncbi:MAG: biotin/lipoyl-binding protein [Dehalococcoidia bacterium]|nr:biotin/lipoyl-binding protein [Dehalococcoidia bacterium]